MPHRSWPSRAVLLYCRQVQQRGGAMRTIEIPEEVARFRLPEAVQARLQYLLDRQDAGGVLSHDERQEAEGLVDLAEFLSLIHLRVGRATPNP